MQVVYQPAGGGFEEESMEFPAGVQPVNVSGLNPGPWTLDPGPCTLNPEPWTLNPEP